MIDIIHKIHPDLVTVRNLTLTIKGKTKKNTAFTWIVLNINFNAPILFEPKTEKMFVSINGKETEIKL